MNSRHWMESALGLLSQTAEEHEGLADFQQTAVSRLIEMITQFGGALLADAVGLGKTRTSLHAAMKVRRRACDARPIVICTRARLVSMWRQSCVSYGLTPDEFRIVTHTSLSRRAPAIDASLVIVDEAHHFRNPHTKRAQQLELLTSGVPILLVTATPVVNSVWDLYHLLRFFLSDHDTRPWTGVDLRDAFVASNTDNTAITELLQLVCVRREDVGEFGPLSGRPDVELSLLRYKPSSAEKWIWANLEPSMRRMTLDLLADDWPRSLFVDHILRAWEGGPYELDRSLTQLQAFHERWLELDAQGRVLDRASFGDFFGAQGEQSVLGFMFEQRESKIERQIVFDDLSILHDIRVRLNSVLSERAGMSLAIRELIQSGGKWLIFASYQRTAEGLYRELTETLGSTTRIGLVTGNGARATGLGRVKVDELVQRFAPKAHDIEILEHHELQILITTDCLSEGVNLQDCCQMIFLDLPWTPHAVEQRIGRLVRPGNAGETVKVYLPRPQGWSDTLGMRHRIQTKAKHAEASAMGFHSLRRGPKRASPLEVLTQIDSLRPEHAPPPFHARGNGPRAEMWVLMRVTTNGFNRIRLVDAHAASGGLEHLVPRMMTHIDHPTAVKPCTPAIEVTEVCDEVWNRCQAAAWAPVQVDIAQLEAWRWLLTLDRSEADWLALRAKIFSPLTRGQLAVLRRLVSRGNLQRLETEILRWKVFDATVSVEVLASLSISPEATRGDDRQECACEGETPTGPLRHHC